MEASANKSNPTSLLLKIALFATGLSGIVAEYILSTLASYFLGNSTIQWTMTISIMLFSMGLGARISKKVECHLIEKFIAMEFILSILITFSTFCIHLTSHINMLRGIIIYGLSIAIGLFIGMEIPIVVRLNQTFESLKINIANVLEKDYYGALAGGVLYAFFLLPIFGLTYTPIILGSINLLVALVLLYKLKKHIPHYIIFRNVAVILCTLILFSFIYAKKIIYYGEQNKYKDKIIYSHQSRYQKIVMTQWRDDYWLYINGNEQFSSVDEHLYHEPFVHPILSVLKKRNNILVLGGGDGLSVREILKYKDVEQITVVDLDPAMTDFAKEDEILTRLNKNSLNNTKVKIVNEDGLNFLERQQSQYNAIFVDLPDPKNINLNKLYSAEFYIFCQKRLTIDGLMITQASSPSFAPRVFECIKKTMEHAGLDTVPMHNYLQTLGEWGWIAGKKNISDKSVSLKELLLSATIDDKKTRWLNNAAMKHILYFGKSEEKSQTIEVNMLLNPVLYRYYLNSNWELF